jgi:hypothetical protein
MIYQIFSHAFYWLWADRSLRVVFKWVQTFLVIFNIRLGLILLKSAVSFSIWYPNFPCYLFSFSDSDFKQIARRIIWKEMSVNIRQATLFSAYVHCCMDFTHQVDICTLFVNTLQISARKLFSLSCECQEENCSDVVNNVIRQSTVTNYW